jgi:outer membrane protein, heavy metal efflux system
MPSQRRHSQGRHLWSKHLLWASLYGSITLGTLCGVFPDAYAVEQDAIASLDLPSALSLAQQNYALKSQRLQVEIQAAQIVQARQWTNPSLQIGAGDVPSITGTGTELNAMWQQPFNPAQQEQIEVAQQQWKVSQWSLQQQSQTLQRDVTQLFYEGLMWQAYLEQTQQLLENASRMQKIVAAQYAQGKVLLAEHNRAQIAQEQLRIQQQNTQIQYQETQMALATQLNLPPPFRLLGTLILDLRNEDAAQPQTTLAVAPQEDTLHPELQARQAQIAQAQKTISLQKALIWPQSTWGVGVRATPDENNVGVLTQFTIPVPALHQNQGGIQGSEQALAQAQIQQQNTAFSLRTRWQQTLKNYQLTRQSLVTYQTNLLPLAQKNLELSERTYQEGKQSYLEVLDAQRSNISLQQAYLLQWGQYHRLRAELEYLQPGRAPLTAGEALK